MSRVLRLRRGTTAETNAFRGQLAEVTVDTSNWSLVVHDNATVGGHRIATESFVSNNKAVTTVGTTAPTSNIQAGSTWYDSNSGRLYVYYSSTWVDASPTIDNNIVGNISIDDTTISSTQTNANIILQPNGTGQVKVNRDAGLSIGSTYDLSVFYSASGVGGNPYKRMQVTTARNGNANVGINIYANDSTSMFFNPQTGNIGVNSRNPSYKFGVNGTVGGQSFHANTGYDGGFKFQDLGLTGIFHIENSNIANEIKIIHEGVEAASFFNNNYTSLSGAVNVYSDMQIGGNAFLPKNTVIGDGLNFSPINAKLNYSDDVDGFSQFAMQNQSNGATSSTDISIFADNGNDSINFVDMGITSSAYNDSSYTLYGPNDAYIVSAGDAGTKLLLNTYNDADIVFATGGTLASNEIARFQNGEGLVMHGNVIPASNVSYNLGTTGDPWHTLHVDNIMLNGSELSPSTITPPSSTPPGSPVEGQLWFDTVTGRLFVRLGTAWIDTSLGTNVTSAPTHSTGRSGDTAGLIAYDNSYMYYCTASYDSSTHIWKRVAWSVGTW